MATLEDLDKLNRYLELEQKYEIHDEIKKQSMLEQIKNGIFKNCQKKLLEWKDNEYFDFMDKESLEEYLINHMHDKYYFWHYDVKKGNYKYHGFNDLEKFLVKFKVYHGLAVKEQKQLIEFEQIKEKLREYDFIFS